MHSLRRCNLGHLRASALDGERARRGLALRLARSAMCVGGRIVGTSSEEGEMKCQDWVILASVVAFVLGILASFGFRQIAARLIRWWFFE